MNKIAFVQGRLVDLIDGKIQAFPRDDWEKELKIASENNINFIELTVDLKNIWENPITSKIGQEYLKGKLSKAKINPLACTADFIMHSPPWFGGIDNFNQMKFITEEVIEGLSNLDCKIIVIPFVDESSIKNINHKIAIDFLKSLTRVLEKKEIKVAIESDFEPKKLKSFIAELPSELFGINYDIGNSASLGYDFYEEFDSYFERIIHIHIKDRIFNGTTVPLGEGNANLKDCFKILRKEKYEGNFSMQTARDHSGKHVQAMLRYIKIIDELLDI